MQIEFASQEVPTKDRDNCIERESGQREWTKTSSLQSSLKPLGNMTEVFLSRIENLTIVIEYILLLKLLKPILS